MTTTIALAGKGGVGKTTVAALIIKYLIDHRSGSVLAIDADPSSNLNLVLGLPLEWTIGDIREDMLSQVKASLTQGGAAMGAMQGGISKREYLDYQVHTALSEGKRVDLIAMGRGEGPGCYCAVNHNLREVIDSISRHYAFVVIDNEAGMEHLSRRTTRDVEELIIVSDPSPRGLITARRIADMCAELEIHIQNRHLVVNRLTGALDEALDAFVRDAGTPLMGTIPSDDRLIALEASGRCLLELGDESPAYQAVASFMDRTL